MYNKEREYAKPASKGCEIIPVNLPFSFALFITLSEKSENHRLLNFSRSYPKISNIEMKVLQIKIKINNLNIAWNIWLVIFTFNNINDTINTWSILVSFDKKSKNSILLKFKILDSNKIIFNIKKKRTGKFNLKEFILNFFIANNKKGAI